MFRRTISTKKIFPGFGKIFCNIDVRLLFFDSTNGALSRASTAIYTEIGVNFVLAVAFADSVTRTYALASAACNTIIGNFVSHSEHLL